MNPPILMNQRVKVAVFLFPFIVFIALFGIKAFYPGVYSVLIREDGSIENIQAFIYLISSLLAFHISAKFFGNGLISGAILHGVLAIGLLFISFEEISWGQRLLDFGLPEFFTRNNTQNETTIHNLAPFQFALHGIYILVGAYGSFAWILKPHIKPRLNRNLRALVNYLAPDWFISPYFLITFLTYILLELFCRPGEGSFLRWKDQEVAELILSFGFLIFVISNHVKLKNFLIHRN